MSNPPAWLLALLAMTLLPGLSFAGNSTEDRPAQTGLHLDMTGRYSIRHDLRETFTFSPAPGANTGGEKARWSRKWSDWNAYAGISYDVIDRDRFVFRPGIHLGTSQGEFSASNASNGFSESWGTHAAFLWGGYAVGEVRSSRTSGPFARVGYSFFEAGSTEDWEKLENSNPRADPDGHDARFEWQEHEASLTFGWRLGTILPMAGVKYSCFRLKKWLRYHISESDANSEDLEVVRALNGEESRYRYLNDAPLSPFLALEWRVHPNLAVSAGANIAGDEDYALKVLWAF